MNRAGIVVVAASLLVGAGVSPVAAKPARVTVVASFYPLAWAAQEVGGHRVEVTDLTPSGAEPHDLELTTDDRDAIEDADLVIVLGGGFQPAVEQAAEQRDGPTLTIIEELPATDRARARDDPHIWLDPVLMKLAVVDIANVLHRLGGVRTRRAATTISSLLSLDLTFRAGLGDCARDVIVTSHEAFGWLASRYGLTQEAIAGIDPEAEPDPKRLGDLARTKGVTTIFTEDLVSPKVAETVAREAGGLRTQVLSPLESLSTAQRARRDDYVTVMLANLEKLRAALGCR